MLLATLLETVQAATSHGLAHPDPSQASRGGGPPRVQVQATVPALLQPHCSWDIRVVEHRVFISLDWPHQGGPFVGLGLWPVDLCIRERRSPVFCFTLFLVLPTELWDWRQLLGRREPLGARPRFHGTGVQRIVAGNKKDRFGQELKGLWRQQVWPGTLAECPAQ